MLMTKIRRKMHIGIWAIAIIFIGSIFLYFGMGGKVSDKSGQDKKLSRFVLKIGDKKVAREMFNYEFKTMLNIYQSYGMDTDEYAMRMRVQSATVRRILSQEVLIREAGKRKIEVTTAEVAREIKKERDGMVGPANEQKNPGLAGRFKNYLEQNKKNREFRTVLSRQGIDYKQYKEIVRRRLIAGKAIKALAKELGDKEDKKAHDRALQAWQKIKSGEKFEKIAAKYTEDDATKETEGLLGWKKRADLEQNVSALAFKMKPGDFSRPEKTSLGYQIIKVDAVKKPSGPEYEQFRKNYIEQLQKENPKGGVPAERDIQRTFEQVLLKHILFKLKDGNTLADEWVKKQIDDKKIKYTVLDKEIDAFMKLEETLAKENFTQKDLERVKKSYEDLAGQYPEDYNLFTQIGFLYERMNEKLDETLKEEEKKKKEKAKDKDKDKDKEEGDEEEDPYAAAGDDEEKLKTTKYLQPALDSYLKAYDLAQEKGDYDLREIVMGVARVSDTLYDYTKDKKAKKKLKKQAVDFYMEAFNFSTDNLYLLSEIKKSLEKFDAKKQLAEVEEEIKFLQEEMAEQGQIDPAMLQQLQQQQSQSETQTITVGGEEEAEEAESGEQAEEQEEAETEDAGETVDDQAAQSGGGGENKTPPAAGDKQP